MCGSSSGIQILPAILPQASKITTFIREPSWIVSGVAGFEPRKFEEKEKEEFAKQPSTLLKFRRGIEQSMNRIFPLFLADSATQKRSRESFSASMQVVLEDPVLVEQLIPKWAAGCRRITPGVGYLESLKDEKTTVIYGGIARISPEGCVTEKGKEYAVDILVCAVRNP